MGAAYFYHLSEQSLETALTTLIGKARGAGWRVEVRGRERAMIERLDQALWTSAPAEEFPAHGIADGVHDAHQPVLLTLSSERSGAECLMSVDGAPLSPEDVSSVERACLLFDGGDGGAVEAARAQWRSLTSAGISAQYWSDEGGRWQKKAES